MALQSLESNPQLSFATRMEDWTCLGQLDILGISELKWTGMGEFNSDGHYIYYCGQESLRKNGAAIMVNKRVQNAYLDAISKTTE